MTSLSEQLKRLAVPQTSQLVDKLSKPSLLFDFKEAASIDRNTFYSIGCQGLEGLIEINPVFKKYETSLFDSSSINFVRSVESTKRNRLLDQEINRFLIHCSPYFLLNPTHKALEWLINRYLIHEFNSDSLMMLALPYYETTFFAQVVKLLKLKRLKKWEWLLPIKKEGTPLSKTALLNRAASDISFFKFVCDMPVESVKECPGKLGKRLASLFTFYCTTVLGTIERSAYISELHVSHLLPSVISGLSSNIDDYIATSFMILSCLTTKVQLSSTVLQTLFCHIIQISSEKMRTEAVMLMIILCQCNNAISKNSLRLLIKADWFIPCLKKVSSSGMVVLPLISDIMINSIHVIMDKDAFLTETKKFVLTILENIHLNNTEAETLFHVLIDTSMEKGGNNFSSKWLVKVLQSLERRYPKPFDKIISDQKYSNVTKQLLGLRDDYKGQSDIFERLHHPNPVIRTEAVKAVPLQLEPIQSSWLNETMVERMLDDNICVVTAVLKLNDNYLVSLFSKTELINCLINLANKIWQEKDIEWAQLAPKVIKKLGKLIQPDFNELTLLKTIFPFLVITKPYYLVAAKAILESNFSNFNSFIKIIKEEISNKIFNENNLREAVWTSLHDTSSFSCIINDNIQSCKSSSTIMQFVSVLFTSASLPDKVDASMSAELVNHIDELVKESKLMFKKPKELNKLSLNEIAGHCQKDKLPLQVIQHFLRIIIKKTDIQVENDQLWWDTNNASQDFLYNIFKVSLNIERMFSFKVYKDFFCTITSEIQQKENFINTEDYYKLLCNIIVKNPDIVYDCLKEIKNDLLKDSQNNLWIVDLSDSNIVIPTLLIGLTSKVAEVRKIIFEIINIIHSQMSHLKTPYVFFLKELLSWEEEIVCDFEQVNVAIYMLLSPDPAVMSGHPEKLSKKMTEVRETIFSIITNSKTPSHIVASLLELFVYINSCEVVQQLISIAIKTLDMKEFKLDYVVIINNIINKIDPSVISVFEKEEMWNLAEKCLKMHSNEVLVFDKKPPAVLFLKRITREIFDGLNTNGKSKLVDLVVTMNADSENGEANISALNMFKNISMDAALVLPILTSMKEAKVEAPLNIQGRRRKYWNTTPSLSILNTVDWRKGISLFEFIQDKKKITNVQILFPVLFDLLKRCLEFEEQSSVEYAKQLILSTILNFCRKLSLEGKMGEVPKHTIHVELIVQCIRASQNPQTHHHALLLLVEVAVLVPDKVLHDIMPIFTFVGSSVLRMDDAYSFQIILKIIETVIPILIKSIKETEDLTSVQQVLQVFVDALLDIPEHRRFTLILKLITTLGSDGGYLWLFICLVARSEILLLDPSKSKNENCSKNNEKGNLNKKIKILMNMCLEFPATSIITNMYNVIRHVTSLPPDKDGKSSFKKRKSIETLNPIFDVQKNTAKQLRHYKYILIQFISSFFASPSFIDKILMHDKCDNDNLVTSFKLLVHEVLEYLQAVTVQVNKSINHPSSEYWKTMQYIVEDIHAKVNAVLPDTIFLNMMRSILSGKSSARIHKKMLEILNWRLQSTVLPEDGLVSLVPVILNMVKEDFTSTTDTLISQQAAFISLKLLARQVASSYPNEFEQALACVTDVVKKGLKSDRNEAIDAVLACAVLCLAEMVANLGIKSIKFLPKFMPAVIQTISRARSNTDVPEVLLLSVVSTMQKVLECNTQFINPYLDKIFSELSLISYSFCNNSKSHNANVINKLESIRKTLAEKLELRVILPAVKTSYYNLLELKEYGAISYLMLLLGDSLNDTYDWSDLKKFLIKFLDIRHDIAHKDASLIIEPAFISCTVSMVLKMNEKEFKAFFRAIISSILFTNDVHNKVKKLRTIVFYNLCGSLAESLKSIFVPYTNEFLTNAASLLKAVMVNSSEANKTMFGNINNKGCIEKCKELVKSIMNVFLTVFRHDNEHFITEDRFNIIMKPLVDQLENELCFNDDNVLDKLLVPCLAHMSTSIGDDSLWKKYNYEILLKTQNSNMKVRLASLKALCEVVKKLGDSYLPLVPETIPYLSELLEDEEEEVEKACRAAVQELESVLGEEITKFFS